jgi:hypothetical protein
MWYHNTAQVPVQCRQHFSTICSRSASRGCARAAPSRQMRRRSSSALGPRARRFCSHQDLGVACGNVTSMGEHRCFHDDLATSESAPRLRATGVISPYTAAVVVCFGEGESVLRREVRVVHRKLRNGGSWSFFVCPQCARRARVLKLHDGRPKCWRCCRASGVRYRSANGSPVERDAARMARLQKLRELLDGGPARLHPRPGRRLDRRWSLTVSWRRGMIRERQDLLRRRCDGLKLQ